MGIFILVMLEVVEMGFLIWNLKEGRKHRKERGIAAYIMTGGFLLLILIGVIQWSFRYYIIALLLLVQTLTGLIHMLVKHKKKDSDDVADPCVKSRKHSGKASGKYIVKRLASFVGMTVLNTAICLPAILFPQFKKIEATGEHQVLTVTYSYTDQNREETYMNDGSKREVNVEFWYPAENGERYPLVIFSHGSYGIKLSNESLFRELASNGYVVCSIDHPYSSFFTKNEAGHITMMSSDFTRKLMKATTSQDQSEIYVAIQDMMAIKTADINFVIDTIQQKVEEDDTMVYQVTDAAHIAVMGHSLGGSAALGIGRERTDVMAVVSLEAPYMCDIKGVQKDADGSDTFVWEQSAYPVPVLNVYSDSTWGHFSESALYDQNEKMLFDSTGKTYNIHMNGVGHLQLCDLGLISPPLVQMIDSTSEKGADTRQTLVNLNQVTLSFLNYYMKGEGELNLNSEM